MRWYCALMAIRLLIFRAFSSFRNVYAVNSNPPIIPTVCSRSNQCSAIQADTSIARHCTRTCESAQLPLRTTLCPIPSTCYPDHEVFHLVSMPPIKLVKSLLIVFGLTLLAVVTWFMLVHEARQKESQADATSINCTRSLWKNDSPRYLFWKRHYALFHPEWAVLYDVGSACELTDGRTLVSFSYFRSKDPNSGGQSIALFDANNNLIRETGGFQDRKSVV